MNLTPEQYEVLYGEPPPADETTVPAVGLGEGRPPLTFDFPPRANTRRKTYSRSTSTDIVPYEGPESRTPQPGQLRRVLISLAIFISLALSPLLVLLIDREPEVEVLSQSVNAVEPSNLDAAPPTSSPPSLALDSPLTVSQTELDDARVGLVEAEIAPLSSTDGFNPADYLPPVYPDTDGDCQSDREEVLIEESLSEPELSVDTCRVVAGTWIDPFDGLVYDNLQDLTVTQLVPVEHAHRSGASDWSGAEQRAFALDTAFAPSLVVASQFLVDERGAQGPHLWQPVPEAQCRYIVDWIAVKSRWSLRFSADEVEALDQMLEVCDANR